MKGKEIVINEGGKEGRKDVKEIGEREIERGNKGKLRY